MKTNFIVSCSYALVSADLYSLSNSYVGPDFFSGWTFWSDPDPTHGAVKYVDSATAHSSGMVGAAAERVYLGADMSSLTAGEFRRSVRIQSKAVFNDGLFVAEIDHFPSGCGLWPAFWMYGEDAEHRWPAWGEYDIIEGVHEMTRVMTSLHTGAHCNQSAVVQAGNFFTWGAGANGKDAADCDTNANGQWHNQGCAQRGPEASLGREVNMAGGGTYAAEWDPVNKYIRTWFWPKGAEPFVLSSSSVDPATWGLPYSFFTLDPAACSSQHFVNMRLVFDITFCGDLGGATFASSCPQEAVNRTCAEFVAQSPERMQDAYWSIRTLNVYQKPSQPSPVPWPDTYSNPVATPFTAAAAAAAPASPVLTPVPPASQAQSSGAAATSQPAVDTNVWIVWVAAIMIAMASFFLWSMWPRFECLTSIRDCERVSVEKSARPHTGRYDFLRSPRLEAQLSRYAAREREKQLVHDAPLVRPERRIVAL